MTRPLGQPAEDLNALNFGRGVQRPPGRFAPVKLGLHFAQVGTRGDRVVESVALNGRLHDQPELSGLLSQG
jgi:hypothetical protein